MYASSINKTTPQPIDCQLKSEGIGVTSVHNCSSDTEFLISTNQARLDNSVQVEKLLTPDELKLRQIEQSEVHCILNEKEYLESISPNIDFFSLKLWATYLLAKINIYEKTGFDIGPKEATESVVLSPSMQLKIIKNQGIGMTPKQYCQLCATLKDPMFILSRKKLLPFIELTPERIITNTGYENEGFNDKLEP